MTGFNLIMEKERLDNSGNAISPWAKWSGILEINTSHLHEVQKQIGLRCSQFIWCVRYAYLPFMQISSGTRTPCWAGSSLATSNNYFVNCNWFMKNCDCNSFFKIMFKCNILNFLDIYVHLCCIICDAGISWSW